MLKAAESSLSMSRDVHSFTLSIQLFSDGPYSDLLLKCPNQVSERHYWSSGWIFMGKLVLSSFCGRGRSSCALCRRCGVVFGDTCIGRPVSCVMCPRGMSSVQVAQPRSRMETMGVEEPVLSGEADRAVCEQSAQFGHRCVRNVNYLLTSPVLVPSLDRVFLKSMKLVYLLSC
ncbi:hypothetical protein DPMN_062902 [Dreissena polymorpha]|uniref:Uncharacterized protein n=1 Tax=Dreissena polymorpha TaxID=45954 RepID=A0A9D4C9I1_DREPO|nr:hypothetical protein DPMN_062902 [Dreissena polymorpha]